MPVFHMRAEFPSGMAPLARLDGPRLTRLCRVALARMGQAALARVGQAGVLSLALGALGCASGQATGASVGHSARVSDKALQRLQSMSERQADRITELEARIALLESEARSARGTNKLTRTVTIGGNDSARGEVPDAVDADADESVDDRPPIQLHLHGQPRAHARSGPLEPVPVVNERLPVVPLPGRGLPVASIPPLATARTTAPHAADAREAYREALRLLRAREFARAATAFFAFAKDHPGDRLVASARYWEGEAHYALRAYDRALTSFELVIDRFPHSNKLASALYKAGLCHQRLGDAAAAARLFSRLRTQFPDSELVARLSVEGSS